MQLLRCLFHPILQVDDFKRVFQLVRNGFSRLSGDSFQAVKTCAECGIGGKTPEHGNVSAEISPFDESFYKRSRS